MSRDSLVKIIPLINKEMNEYTVKARDQPSFEVSEEEGWRGDRPFGLSIGSM